MVDGDQLPAFVSAPETRWRLAVAVLALLGGVLVLLIATLVFPYHSLNHDEGVYLQQAMMLLDGQLFLDPPVPEAFRPWFFVESVHGMYPKYSPVPAAMFAPFLAVGVPRLALALLGAGIVALVVGIGTELFDRPTGLLAGVVLLASPLFLINTSVFLPYAPTTFLNCAFALAYLRANRTGSRRMAAVAGVAVGVAFFARPYTAFLFALPFVGHALWTLRTRERPVIARQSIVAALGILGVVATLGYNALVTGSLLEFPYHAFAPRDGIGFGVHELLGREIDYTPQLAARVNERVLRTYTTDWVAAGLLGSLLALVGLVLAVRDRTVRRLTLVGVTITVVLGELYFWGTLNMLGDVADPTDGLIYYLGAYYHYDLLVPTSVFAGLTLRTAGQWGWRHLRSIDRFDRRQATAIALALLAAGALVGGGAAASTVADPIQRNQAITDHYEAAYQPFEEQSFTNAVVFLPDPYGPWLNHPFQTLRNDPGYDGPVVYALEGQPFSVIEAFPNRTLYRYSFRNPWPPVVGEPVQPRLRKIQAVDGPAIRLTATAGVPQFADLVSIRLESDAGHNSTTVVELDRSLDLWIDVTEGRATLDGPSIDDAVTIPIEDRDTVRARLFVDFGTGGGFSYGLDLPVEQSGTDVAALSPALELCTVPHACDGAATYVPNATTAGQSLETSLEVRE